MTVRLQTLAGSAGWAVADHALFSLAGMITSLLLAREMPRHTYGAYAVSFAVYMAVLTLHTAIFAEPMLVLASHRFRAQIASYLRSVLSAQVWFSLLVLAVLGGFAFGFLRADDQAELRQAIVAMAMAAPFMNLAQLLRRLCYSLWTPREAALGAVVYLVVLAGTIAVLMSRGWLGLGTVYAALGASSVVSSCGWLWHVAVTRDEAAETRAGAISMRQVFEAHFAFARYGLGSALLGWVPLNAWYLVLPFAVAGEARLAASGHLRALVNLMQPMLQVNAALGTLLVPTFTRLLLQTKTATPWRFTLIMTGLAAAYAPLLALFGPLVNRWLYRGAYPAETLTWCALGAVPACAACYGSLRAFCNAREMTQLPLVATLVSAFGCATIGLGLCFWQPLMGASLGMLLGFALQATTLAWLVQTRAAQPRAAPAAE